MFNDASEKAKAGAVVLYEHLEEPAGAGLVYPTSGDTLALCSLDYRLEAPVTLAMWRKLFGNMGVKLGAPKDQQGSGKSGEHDLLLNGPVNP